MTPTPDPLREACAFLAEALVTQRDALRDGLEDLVARLLRLEASAQRHEQILTDLLGAAQADPDSWERLTARLRLLNAATWQQMETEERGEETP